MKVTGEHMYACTLYSLCARLPFRPFLMVGTGEPNLAERNQFDKRSIAVLGPGELI